MRSVLVMLALLLPAVAPAQSGDKAAANALFDEGRQLVRAKRFAEACAKFEASLAILPQLGVRLNLADCLERTGRLASAYAEFREAASMAARAGDDREDFARQRMAKLDARRPRLVVKLAPGADLPGLVVARDGSPVPPAAFGTEVPVDPGEHTVEAAAPDRVPHVARVEALEGALVSVEIPVLAPVEKPAPPPAPPPEPAPVAAAPPPPPVIRDEVRLRPVDLDPGRGRRRLGLVVGAGGAAATAAGLVFGYLAMSTVNGAKDRGDCNDDLACNAAGVDEVNRARTWGNLSTITVGVGLAALAGGAVLYLTAPEGPRVEVSLSGSGLVVAGSF
jgi:hypothetical protein